MYHGIASKSCYPATAALEKALKLAAAPVINKERPMISFKRPRSSFGSFNLSSRVEAFQPVEDSRIAFPSIEWSNDIYSEEYAEFMAPPATKRRCRGLVRSGKIKYSLSTLGNSLAWNPSALRVEPQQTWRQPLSNAKDDTLAGYLTILLFWMLGICTKSSQDAIFSRHILNKTMSAWTHFYWTFYWRYIL